MMKGKIVAMIVVLMAVAMLSSSLVGLVQAGKGQEKLSFQTVLSGDMSPVPAADPWLTLIPKKSESWMDAQRLKSVWTFADVSATLWIDGEPYYPDDFEFVGYNIQSADILSGPTAEVKETSTFIFDGIGTIVVEMTGKLFNEYTAEQYVVNKGVGFGTGLLEGIKIDIKQSGEGTIMGWDASLFD
jgi:hypothetical protein